MDTSDNNSNRSIPIEEELIDRLEELAEQEQCSVANYVETVLENHVSNRQTEQLG